MLIFLCLFKAIPVTRICLEHPPSLTLFRDFPSLSLLRASFRASHFLKFVQGIPHPSPRIRMSSQVLSKHNHLFPRLLIIGTPFTIHFIFILSLFSFTSLRCRPRFYLSYSFVLLIAHHWTIIVGSISVNSLFLQLPVIMLLSLF